jgi:hypothetical protein
MNDPSTNPPPGGDDVIARVLRSDLSEDTKRQVIRRLVAERAFGESRLNELVDRLIADWAAGLIDDIQAYLRDH